MLISYASPSPRDARAPPSPHLSAPLQRDGNEFTPGNGEPKVIRGSVNAKGVDFGLHGQPSTRQVGSARLGDAQSPLQHGVISTSSLLRAPQLISSNWSIIARFTDSPPVQTLRYSPPHQF